jgi:hypothetical protein
LEGFVKIIVMSAVAALLFADPGHNLVGENWSGQPPVPRS